MLRETLPACAGSSAMTGPTEIPRGISSRRGGAHHEEDAPTLGRDTGDRSQARHPRSNAGRRRPHGQAHHHGRALQSQPQFSTPLVTNAETARIPSATGTSSNTAWSLISATAATN